MKFSLICLLFTITAVTSQAQVTPEPETVTLPFKAANFFRLAYWRGQRDSVLLKSCQNQSKDLLVAIDARNNQVKSYKADSVNRIAERKNLYEQKKVAVDSTATVFQGKVDSAKERSKVKSWIIVGLLAVIIGSHL